MKCHSRFNIVAFREKFFLVYSNIYESSRVFMFGPVLQTHWPFSDQNSFHSLSLHAISRRNHKLCL